MFTFTKYLRKSSNCIPIQYFCCFLGFLCLQSTFKFEKKDTVGIMCQIWITWHVSVICSSWVFAAIFILDGIVAVWEIFLFCYNAIILFDVIFSFLFVWNWCKQHGVYTSNVLEQGIWHFMATSLHQEPDITV